MSTMILPVRCLPLPSKILGPVPCSTAFAILGDVLQHVQQLVHRRIGAQLVAAGLHESVDVVVGRRVTAHEGQAEQAGRPQAPARCCGDVSPA